MTTLTHNSTGTGDPSLLTALLAGERFWPTLPQSLHETGLNEPFLESLICKLLLVNGSRPGSVTSRSAERPGPRGRA